LKLCMTDKFNTNKISIVINSKVLQRNRIKDFITVLTLYNICTIVNKKKV